MENNKKIYLYSGLAVVISVIMYIGITKRKKYNTDPTNDVQPDVTTKTGDVITSEQAIIDLKLQDIFKLPLSQVKSKMLGKEIYSKLENINPRQTPFVNNGWFVNNGVGGRIVEKDTLIGIVTDVVNDRGLLSNNNGNVYKWLKVNPSTEAIQQIKDDSNILIGTKTDTFFVREDVVKLN